MNFTATGSFQYQVGTYNPWISVSDMAGNKKRISWQFSVDHTGPGDPSVIPAPHSMSNIQSPYIRINYSADIYFSALPEWCYDQNLVFARQGDCFALGMNGISVYDGDLDNDGTANFLDNDIDGDGIPNNIDIDDDNDALCDEDMTSSDPYGDVDGDHIPNIDDPDRDGDGNVDQFNNSIGLDPSGDIDSDGSININDADADPSNEIQDFF